MWLYYSVKVAITINIILLVFLVIFIKNGWEIYDKLYVREDDAVTGEFKDFTAYENMFDLDNTKKGSPERRERWGSEGEIRRSSNDKFDF
jgi:hypothetical protein